MTLTDNVGIGSILSSFEMRITDLAAWNTLMILDGHLDPKSAQTVLIVHMSSCCLARDKSSRSLRMQLARFE